jgi:hypothetical protein
MPPNSLALACDPRIPSSAELAALIHGVLGSWAGLPAVPAGLPAPGPARLGLEFSVRLRGPINCLLVMRGEPVLASQLAEASTGDPSAREQGTDAFRELCNLVGASLAADYFCGHTLKFEPFFPEFSDPSYWPSIRPNAECLMMLNRLPLEARIWAELGDFRG